jgi:peptidoglycan/xylan/chitin deacetylase (PgdA/CDA1 family)
MNRPARQALTTFLTVIVLLIARSAAADPYATLLLYHRVGEDKHPTTSITASAFREQMAWLADHDYRVISLAELVATVDAGHAPPRHSVVITFDDTYRSIYDVAAPILAAHHYPYTLFVYTEAMEAHYPDFMTWEQLHELAERPGVEIGNHGHHHAHLIRGHGKTLPTEQLREDVTTAGALLERRLGVPTHYYAFPYGEYTDEAQAAVREAGYRVQLTQDRGSVGVETLLHQLPRNAMVGTRGTLDMMREVLNQPPLPWQARQPATGRLRGQVVGEISIQLSHPQRYWSGQTNLFVSELGRVDAHFDPETGWLRAEVTAPLSRRFNRITASARRREDDVWELTSWMVVTGE